MKTAVTVLGFVVLTCCGWAAAQDLPPDILADQYLLEAAKAMEQGNAQAALRAFGKIEALGTEPPLEFLYFYGKLLVENGTAFNDVLKGQSLLKQYVLMIERTSEHYRPTLALLSIAGDKLEKIDADRLARARIDTRIKELSVEAEEYDIPLLHHAIRENAHDAVAELIARGADVNAYSSSASIFDDGIEMMQLDPCISSGKAPVNNLAAPVALFGPRTDLLA